MDTWRLGIGGWVEMRQDESYELIALREQWSRRERFSRLSRFLFPFWLCLLSGV